MKLATFNLESFGSNRFETDELKPRLEALRPKILELDADILCLQEVNAQKIKGAPHRQFKALDLLLRGTPYADYHRAFSERAPGKGPGQRHNLVVLSRYPVLSSGSLFQTHSHPPYWNPKTAVPPYDEPQKVVFERPILTAVIDIGTERPLHLFVVHLRAPIAAAIRGGKSDAGTWKGVATWAEGYQLSVLKQAAQALELRLAVEEVFDGDEQAQIILAGDFNATSETGTLRMLLADPDDTGAPDLVSRRLYLLDAALPRTQRQTVLHKGRGQALDHILASAEMTGRTTDVRVYNANLLDEVFDAGNEFAGSFHAAMRAEFEL
ncbi:endonuclease/exonuclease/phosphatase family protein [Roseibium salinum]|uniref:Endonuclease/exonuclease/phosphatase family protein n=1 Tax=Roseibium salinum TaxID=1604349 RepID=A0ABT3R7V3_9HYPH|nr:endonuclease/exonuclease/phosphatase family protein [Roseibium sp. DSM 29163]MCX2725078.1 endonuclease/exonuclease/phosphatase family protein [Roseibium sp. DSM 29163]MDN3721024.1 endonuclease/exonuclease/phosphatase family protein [Roseibium salinum]